MAASGSKTRYGIIGCGMMGQEHLRNIALLPDAEVAAIFEPDAAMAAGSSALAPGAEMVPSLDALLDVPGLDCLVIASPNHLHLEQVERIAERRPLPLLVEKPIYVLPDEEDRVKRLEEAFPAPIWVAMEYRYMPPIAAFFQEAPAATGGVQMLSIREHRFPFLHKVGAWNRFNRNTGGTFVEKGCHFFDLMRHVLRGEPVRVMAMGGHAMNHISEQYEGMSPDILDHGYVLIDFDNGTRAMLELCMFAEGATYQEELTATGGSGRIEALVPGPTRFWPDRLGDPPVPKLITSPRDPKGPVTREIPVQPALIEAGDHNGATFYQHQGFLELVRGTRAEPEVTLRDGALAVRMGLAAQRSIQTGQAVEMRRD